MHITILRRFDDILRMREKIIVRQRSSSKRDIQNYAQKEVKHFLFILIKVQKAFHDVLDSPCIFLCITTIVT
jgi:hypothetical protein